MRKIAIALALFIAVKAKGANRKVEVDGVEFEKEVFIN